MSVCSPVANSTYKKDRTCFDKAALVRLAEAWNKNDKENPIKHSNKMSKNKLWSAINERMQPKCKGGEREACWVDHLAKASDPIKKKLRPVAPKEWEKNPYEWLSNFDIEDVMFQYQDDPQYKFKFFGVFPVDFAVKTGIFGQCLQEETCNINFKKLRSKGYKYAGIVINMDHHNEPGSHWTGLFIVMDPRSPSYGAYYYNSVPNPPPKEVDMYMKMLRKKAEEDTPNKPFKLEYNTYRHQYKNTECGVFSMAYLVRWIVLLRQDPATLFDNIVRIKIHDEDIHKLRKKFYRKSSV